MADALLSHGPCTGQWRHVSDDTQTGDHLTCSGVRYTLYQVYQGEFLGLPPGYKAPPHVTATATKANPAWRRLLHGVVVTVPASLEASRGNRKAIRQLGHHPR